MTRPADITAERVVLSSRVWCQEIALELTRLGHSEEQAQRSARSMLAHILGRASWPREAFLVDERGKGEPR